jgi:hypothetical protein
MELAGLPLRAENLGNMLKIISTVLALWTGWYIWRFILVPGLYPNDPAELPYSLPGIGHAWSMLTAAHDMFSKGRYVHMWKPSTYSSLRNLG